MDSMDAERGGGRVHALPVRLPSSERCIERIRELLAMAERGEVCGVAFAVQLRGSLSASGHAIEDDGDISHLVTALERVKLRLLSLGHDE
jgi:hypothetical protein